MDFAIDDEHGDGDDVDSLAYNYDWADYSKQVVKYIFFRPLKNSLQEHTI